MPTTTPWRGAEAMRGAAVTLLALLAAGPAMAQGDGGAGEDAAAAAPAVQSVVIETRPDLDLVGAEGPAAGTYPLPVAPFGTGGPSTEVVTGTVTKSAYASRTDGPGVAEVISGYRDSLAGQGLDLVLDCAGLACGGFDFRFGVDLLPPRLMRIDVADFAQLTMRSPGGAVDVSVLASRVRGRTHLQVVTVTRDGAEVVSATAELPPADAPAVQPPATVTETPTETPAETPGETPTDGTAGSPVPAPGESELLALLRRDGHVPVAGLDFGTGGAELTAASAPALDALAAMLHDNADLQIAIVGHSDNVGGLDSNIELSRRRADAVRRALIERGVARSRLEARGVGYLAPVTTNETEAGRALNRRVELVLR